MKHFKIFAIALTALFAASCSDDDATTAVPVNEEEVITTVTATFVPQGGGDTVTLTYRDLDGDGPNLPVPTISGPFISGKTYAGSVTFLNELVNPAENITEEIEEEGDEHQIFFVQTGGNLGTFTYTDTDVNGKPVGLNVNFNTSNTAATGQLRIVLVHEPNKNAEGVAQGIITNAGGATDAEAVFNIQVVQP
ncbi:type 1 periplasmic binding fold superfamily protein [Flavobacterium sp. J372]|uniref:type 1 periplasmic binding fold superfamily protein n=1 Tax=Flavobacterium sp. J372 TaxID=2898436 RepID=UPI002150FA5B|nr:type 1 periplasmic binding fold superfamily protein [Flavobacterium sp. J372]MCR5863445.1 type 1 periplasmic binding fold superfamily protein [Flavobacterium sp. J372]